MSYIQQIKNSVGRNVTIKVVNDGEVTEWGDQINKTVEENEVCCVFEPEGREVEEAPEGDFSNEQIRAFFDITDSNIEEGNIIVTDRREYRIDEVAVYEMPGRGGHYEVRANVV